MIRARPTNPLEYQSVRCVPVLTPPRCLICPAGRSASFWACRESWAAHVGIVMHPRVGLEIFWMDFPRVARASQPPGMSDAIPLGLGQAEEKILESSDIREGAAWLVQGIKILEKAGKCDQYPPVIREATWKGVFTVETNTRDSYEKTDMRHSCAAGPALRP